jgi:hypothetical protein
LPWAITVHGQAKCDRLDLSQRSDSASDIACMILMGSFSAYSVWLTIWRQIVEFAA